MRSVTSKLRERRQELELPQIVVAKLARVAQTTYSGYERGERPVPEKVAVRIARVLRADIQTLFTDDAEAGR